MQRESLSKFLGSVTQGDCLEVLSKFPDKSIDMILCDLPYGTTQNTWDYVIDLPTLWYEYERIIKDNGAIVLTAQGIFTAKLIMSNQSLFKYKIVWIKSSRTNYLNAKKQPLRAHEDICIFYKHQPTYNPQKIQGKPYRTTPKSVSHSYGTHHRIETVNYGNREPIDVVFYDDVIYTTASPLDAGKYHPTQKPVELGSYLIKTFTNPGDIVLDNACGSGSFLLSAMLENRRFIGIEKNEITTTSKMDGVDYIKICYERLAKAHGLRQ